MFLLNENMFDWLGRIKDNDIASFPYCNFYEAIKLYHFGKLVSLNYSIKSISYRSCLDHNFQQKIELEISH